MFAVADDAAVAACLRAPGCTAKFVSAVGHAFDGWRAAAWVLRPAAPRSCPTVVFLHGWNLEHPLLYRGHIGYLLRRGVSVVFPAFQTLARPLDALLRRGLGPGMERGKRAVRSTRTGLAFLAAACERRRCNFVLYGHSLGAEVAVAWGLLGGPLPSTVLFVEPALTAELDETVLRKAADALRGARAKVLHGADDRIVTLEEASLKIARAFAEAGLRCAVLDGPGLWHMSPLTGLFADSAPDAAAFYFAALDDALA